MSLVGDLCEYCNLGHIIQLLQKYCNNCYKFPEDLSLLIHVNTGQNTTSISISTNTKLYSGRKSYFSYNLSFTYLLIRTKVLNLYVSIIGDCAIPTQAIAQSVDLFMKIRDIQLRMTKSNNKRGIMAAALFISCNQVLQSRTVKLISSMFNVTLTIFLSGYRYIYTFREHIDIPVTNIGGLDLTYINTYARLNKLSLLKLAFLLEMYIRIQTTAFSLFYCAHTDTKCNGLIYIIDKSVDGSRYYSYINRHNTLFQDIYVKYNIPMPRLWLTRLLKRRSLA